MKTSWIIGVVTLWILVFTTEMMVTEGTAFNPSSGNPFNALFSMNLANFSSIVSAGATFIMGCGIWLINFIGLVFLWSPSVWTGYYIWIWYILCVPIGVGMLFGIMTIIRGTSSS